MDDSINPSMFDLIVIGTGPSASTVATKAVQDNKRVAIIEAREFGGTCALRGCNPKKVYANAADLMDRVRGGKGKLIEYDDVRIDWAKLLDFKREFTQPVAESSEQKFKELGMTTIHGAASFTGPNSVKVGDEVLTAQRIYLGVGARPRPLGIPGADLVHHSDDFLELTELPKRVVFIGGGYISMEFACVAARYDCEVVVLEQSDRVLSPFDPDLVGQLVDYSRQQGIQTFVDSKVTFIETARDSFAVHYERAGVANSVQTDLVVHGAGRVPNVDGLNLEAAEVAFGDRGVEVDSFMRSVSNPSVFAGGDCAASGRPPLTPTANEEARVIAKNLFAPSPEHKPDYGIIPQVAFSVPSIATIGMSQVEAEETHDVAVRHDDTSTWGSIRKTGQACAGYKVLVCKKTDKILGAHLLGPGAEETINLFALAMKHGLTATDIKSTLMAFPTFGSDVRRMV